MAEPTNIIKICGLTDNSGVAAAIDAGANWIGFVFVPSSPRYILPEDAALLATKVPAGVQIVGLFADETPAQIASVAARVPLDKIQLHGTENADMLAEVRKASGRPVIVARGISITADLEAIRTLVADYLLLDARAPDHAKAQGGHGTPFDWSLLEGFQADTPWLLAGGLRADNVADGVAAAKTGSGFCGVDVSSGVEINRGQKDPVLVKEFVAAARRALKS